MSDHFDKVNAKVRELDTMMGNIKEQAARVRRPVVVAYEIVPGDVIIDGEARVATQFIKRDTFMNLADAHASIRPYDEWYVFLETEEDATGELHPALEKLGNCHTEGEYYTRLKLHVPVPCLNPETNKPYMEWVAADWVQGLRDIHWKTSREVARKKEKVGLARLTRLPDNFFSGSSHYLEYNTTDSYDHLPEICI
jgi:hypothetical protein